MRLQESQKTVFIPYQIDGEENTSEMTAPAIVDYLESNTHESEVIEGQDLEDITAVQEEASLIYMAHEDEKPVLEVAKNYDMGTSEVTTMIFDQGFALSGDKYQVEEALNYAEDIRTFDYFSDEDIPV